MTEREWREASDLRPSRIGLAAILVLATVLRFWALGHGIPHSLAVDEPEVLERAVNMMKNGTLRPGFFDYPTLYIYVQMAVACVRFMAGAIAGTWSSLDQAPPGAFYLWGRAVTAITGVATVLVVFQIGMRWGARHALLGAGLMCVLPLHVAQSHYALTDVPLTFLVALTLLLSLQAHERNTPAAFAIAGAAAGLATATKYNGAIALIMPLVACWMTSPARPSRLVCALAAIGGCIAAFIVAAPFSVLDLPGFLNGFARLANEYKHQPPPAEPAWILYLKHLRGVFGWPALLLSGIGLCLAATRLVRGPGRVRWALVTVFPLLYYWFISDQRLVFGRYLLPIAPALCLLVAAAVISGVSLLRRYEIPRAPRTALISGLTIAALLPPTIDAVGWDRMISRRGTVEHAYEWVQHNVPPGSKIVIESRMLLLPAQYNSSNVPQLRSTDYNAYRGRGVEYLIASSQCYGPYFESPERFPQEYADYMRIFGEAREVARFSPTPEQPGPEVRILQVRR